MTIGPEANVIFEVEFSLDLTGLFSAGFVCDWKGVGARLDLKDSSNSKVLGTWDLEGHCTKILDAKASLTITVTPSVKFSVGLTVALLPGVTDKLTGKAALVEQVSVILTGKVSTADGDNGKCKRLQPRFTGDLKSALYITATGFDDFPLHDPFIYPLFDECVE